ncbi:MAG: hypothetical protein ABSG51_17845, partial [Terracidiphilus sp.]
MCLVFIPAFSKGQTPASAPPAPAPAEDTPHFSTNVDEVSLDLVVHDKHHKPVLDLKPEEVAVTDNGTP